MIRLYLTGENEIFIYDVEDWSILRKTHRIIGQLVGNTPFLPALPLKLLTEEALLLIEKNIAKMYKVTITDYRNCSENFNSNFLKAQQNEYKKIRKIQLETLIDKIIEKRRNFGDQRTKDEIFNEELEKSSLVSEENLIWPIFLQKLDLNKLNPISVNEILPFVSHLKSKVFKDLWERGYYITRGEKFGGDFLVYSGDPIIHHALFIVKCVELEEGFSSIELIAFGRLGTTVKKRAVLASLKNDTVMYITINWIDA